MHIRYTLSPSACFVYLFSVSFTLATYIYAYSFPIKELVWSFSLFGSLVKYIPVMFYRLNISEPTVSLRWLCCISQIVYMYIYMCALVVMFPIC